MIYLKLLLEFLYVGLFSFGGGYATIPLIQNRIVMQHAWITQTQFIDMITISQMTPGPLTVNISTFVGLGVGGMMGSIIATLGVTFVGVFSTLFVYHRYTKAKNKNNWELFLKSLRISSTALIILATVSIFDLLLMPEGFLDMGILIPFGLVLTVSLWRKLDTIHILVISGILGFLFMS